MERSKYIYWQDDEMWLGYLEEYPDYMTQGGTLEELKENLRDIYRELNSGKTRDRENEKTGKRGSRRIKHRVSSIRN